MINSVGRELPRDLSATNSSTREILFQLLFICVFDNSWVTSEDWRNPNVIKFLLYNSYVTYLSIITHPPALKLVVYPANTTKNRIRKSSEPLIIISKLTGCITPVALQNGRWKTKFIEVKSISCIYKKPRHQRLPSRHKNAQNADMKLKGSLFG